jgi:hypothetical protein
LFIEEAASKEVEKDSGWMRMERFSPQKRFVNKSNCVY